MAGKDELSRGGKIVAVLVMAPFAVILYGFIGAVLFGWWLFLRDTFGFRPAVLLVVGLLAAVYVGYVRPRRQTSKEL